MEKILERKDIIKQYIRDKDVLDLWCVDHSADTEKTKASWFHRFIKDNAKSVVWVDMEKDEIEKLKKLWYNMHYGNVEDFDLWQKFDVVVAGEIIEHLSNFGLFIESAKKHLKNDWKLIISTPSPYSFYQLYQVLFKNRTVIHKQHTCFLVPSTLESLVDRYGMKIERTYFVDPPLKKRFFLFKLLNQFRKFTSTWFLSVVVFK